MKGKKKRKTRGDRVSHCLGFGGPCLSRTIENGWLDYRSVGAEKWRWTPGFVSFPLAC